MNPSARRLAEALYSSIYTGQRLGYYRALSEGPPLTAGRLAARTGLPERAVRAWLEAQAAFGLLEEAPGTGEAETHRYRLAPDHADVLEETLKAIERRAAQM